jgi:hypothetical protein
MKSKLSCIISSLSDFLIFHQLLRRSIRSFTGLAVRNIGMITDETLPQTVSTTVTIVPVPYVNYIICRRQYMLGVPLAIKLGS